MGVRAEGSALGRSPAFEYPEYIKGCKDFLIKQIDIQKPKIIVALGLHLIGFISDMSPELSDVAKIKNFKKLDERNLAGFSDVSFYSLPGFKTSVIFITHPTYWHLNVLYRTYNGLKEKDAEAALINKFYKR